MRKVKDLDGIIKAVGEIGKEAKKISTDLQRILQGIKNPDDSAEKTIQELLALSGEICSTLKSVEEIREIALEKRIKLEEKGPP